ncbi:MAG: hypothetical protein M3069_22845 [Chloroflexota bacterium]|nr:hypothetical protein [Chloroflexota bacterium]
MSWISLAKVMYASDGISVPELHWIAINTRRPSAWPLDQMIAAQFVTAGGAEEITHDVLYRTAQRGISVAH